MADGWAFKTFGISYDKEQEKGYFCGRILDLETGYIDLTKPLSREEEKTLSHGICLGMQKISPYRARGLKLMLKKHKEKVMKIFKDLSLDKGLLKGILKSLQRSGLKLDEQLKIAKKLQKIFRDFARDLHSQLTLEGLELRKLPQGLRQFLICLVVLKAELCHLHRLRIEQGRLERFNRSELDRKYNRNLDYYSPQRFGLDLDEIGKSRVDREVNKKNNIFNNNKILSKTSWDKHFTRNKTNFYKQAEDKFYSYKDTVAHQYAVGNSKNYWNRVNRIKKQQSIQKINNNRKNKFQTTKTNGYTPKTYYEHYFGYSVPKYRV